LTPGDAHNLIDSTGQLLNAQDVCPMALASHALRVESEDRDAVNNVMRGVLKAMKG